jgi:GPI ethanolamine phosphate transferase 3 subunit O
MSIDTDEMRRSSKNIDSLIRQIIDKIDDQTTLLCFGDHGTKIDGSHGGEEVEEMRTAMFAYQKKPFPMM